MSYGICYSVNRLAETISAAYVVWLMLSYIVARGMANQKRDGLANLLYCLPQASFHSPLSSPKLPRRRILPDVEVLSQETLFSRRCHWNPTPTTASQLDADAWGTVFDVGSRAWNSDEASTIPSTSILQKTVPAWTVLDFCMDVLFQKLWSLSLADF